MSVFRVDETDQPTILRGNTSVTHATYVMSATHNWFGRYATNRLFTLSTG